MDFVLYVLLFTQGIQAVANVILVFIVFDRRCRGKEPHEQPK